MCTYVNSYLAYLASYFPLDSCFLLPCKAYKGSFTCVSNFVHLCKDTRNTQHTPYMRTPISRVAACLLLACTYLRMRILCTYIYTQHRCMHLFVNTCILCACTQTTVSHLHLHIHTFIDMYVYVYVFVYIYIDKYI